jgi:hypothetical protein
MRERAWPKPHDRSVSTFSVMWPIWSRPRRMFILPRVAKLPDLGDGWIRYDVYWLKWTAGLSVSLDDEAA